MTRTTSTISALLFGAASLGALPLTHAQEAPDPHLPLRATTVDLAHDDFASKLAPPLALQSGPLDGDVAAGAALPHIPATAAPKLTDAELPSGVHPRPPIDTVLYDTTAAPGHVLARGRDWKAEFGPTGLMYIPVLGRTAPRNLATSVKPCLLHLLALVRQREHAGRQRRPPVPRRSDRPRRSRPRLARPGSSSAGTARSPRAACRPRTSATRSP